MQPVDSGVDQLVKQIAFQSVNGHAIPPLSAMLPH